MFRFIYFRYIKNCLLEKILAKLFISGLYYNFKSISRYFRIWAVGSEQDGEYNLRSSFWSVDIVNCNPYAYFSNAPQENNTANASPSVWNTWSLYPVMNNWDRLLVRKQYF